MELNFLHLKFVLQLEENIDNRYALFNLRSNFEEALLRTTGCGKAAILPCSEKDGCVYHQLFSQRLSANPAALKRFQKPSLPFVFQIELLPPVPNSGSTVELGLVLVGWAVNYTAEFIVAMERLFKDTCLPLALRRIDSIGYRGDRHTVMIPGGALVADALETLSFEALHDSIVLSEDAVTIHIETPLRLVADGITLRELSFSHLIRALIRRVTSIFYYYGGEEIDLDYKWLAEQSRQVKSIHAEFKWLSFGNKWSGVVGKVTFAEVIPDFHPFLLVGEYLHVGKGASFGFGRYSLQKE